MLYTLFILYSCSLFTLYFSQDPAPENAGLYKCVVHNRYGEINANLSLNIEVAPVIRERPIIKRVEKKKSIVLQCAVAAEQDIEVQWFKEGQVRTGS